MPRPKEYTYHSAKTGEFVTEQYANDNPDLTVAIRRQPNLDLASPMELLQELSKRSIEESRRHAGWLTTRPGEDK